MSLREVELGAKGHTASEGQSQHLDPGLSVSKDRVLAAPTPADSHLTPLTNDHLSFVRTPPVAESSLPPEVGHSVFGPH